MMKTKFLLIGLFFLLVFHCANAQKAKIKFHSINTFGIAVGQSGGDGLFQSVNGVKYENLFAGIGFGANYYHYTSYPLFLDARAYFGEKKKAFCYADIGYNFNGNNKPEKNIFYSSYKFSGGIYTDVGIGYQMKFIKNSTFLVNAGFSYKEIDNKVGVVSPCLVGPCPVDYSKYEYGFGTVVLKAGIDF